MCRDCVPEQKDDLFETSPRWSGWPRLKTPSRDPHCLCGKPLLISLKPGKTLTCPVHECVVMVGQEVGRL